MRSEAINATRQLHVGILENKRRQILSTNVTTTFGDPRLQIFARTKKKRQLAALDMSWETSAHRASASTRQRNYSGWERLQGYLVLVAAIQNHALLPLLVPPYYQTVVHSTLPRGF